ncbi:MAG: hypothetical protein AB7F86_07670 [Bdellovibrionales bacterium]
MVKRIFAVLSLTVCLAGCKGGSSDSSGPNIQAANSAGIFSDQVSDFVVRVYYESGADPYVGNLGTSSNAVWSLTKISFENLFHHHVGRRVYTPVNLAQMIALGAKGKSQWTRADLLTLMEAQAPALFEAGSANLSVFFLKRTFADDPGALVVHFPGDRAIFIFKDVIVGLGGDAITQRYIEQAAVVHGLGHAAGLVNNGLPMVSNHEDPSHPGHASDTADVMHFSVGSAAGALAAQSQNVATGALNLFGAASLADAQAFHP